MQSENFIFLIKIEQLLLFPENQYKKIEELLVFYLLFQYLRYNENKGDLNNGYKCFRYSKK